MKAWQTTALELLLIVLLLPQAFVLCYFFGYFFSGGNSLGMLKAVTSYGLTISWVSAPFLVLLALLVKALIGSRARGLVVLPLCIATGYLWVASWNLLVYEVFSYLRATLPILLCALVTAGWALARAIYLEGLPTQPPDEPSEPAGASGETDSSPANSEGTGLSE